MRVEISIAKEKAGKMPKGSLEALKEENDPADKQTVR